MREILFRGKRCDNGEWVKGSFWDEITGELGGIAQYGSCVFRHVDLTTVGQFTGLIDKNGKKIFEGDIVRLPELFGGEIAVIRFLGTEFKASGSAFCYQICESMVVLGNIHDNPELLENL